MLDHVAKIILLLQDCLDNEKDQPLLLQLEPYLCPGRPVYAAHSAVSQFELLLQQFGGKKERARWQVWLNRITIIEESGNEPSLRMQALTESSSMTEVMFYSLL